MPFPKNCLRCNSKFIGLARRNKYCSQRCGSPFQKDMAPWNKGVKGLHLSPKSQWRKGNKAHNKLPLGSIRIRKDRSGKPRAWVKVREPNIWKHRSVVVWEKHHGPVPRGMLVHHKSRNTLDDGVRNLCLQTRAEHLAEHRPEFEMKRRLAAALARWRN